MTFRIQPPATAFANPHKQRSPRVKQTSHLDFIRGLPCVICLKHGVHAAHIRYGSPAYFKRESGIAEKPDDKWTVPLCPEHHTEGQDAQHRTGDELGWWLEQGINPLELATKLKFWTGDEEVGELIVRGAKS